MKNIIIHNKHSFNLLFLKLVPVDKCDYLRCNRFAPIPLLGHFYHLRHGKGQVKACIQASITMYLNESKGLRFLTFSDLPPTPREMYLSVKKSQNIKIVRTCENTLIRLTNL